MTKTRDLTGIKFNMLQVVSRVENDKGGNARWNCVCDCGDNAVVRGSHLGSGGTKSCGCLRGGKGDPSARQNHRSEYAAWVSMRGRCQNPDNIKYSNYGGRGVGVSKEWSESFEAFIRDMGKKPTKAHSLDRINNDGDYDPANCRWATPKEQGRNKRTNRTITAFGLTLCLSEWAERTGIGEYTIMARIQRGWGTEDTLSMPVRKQKKRELG